jgi:hypothetical protein
MCLLGLFHLLMSVFIIDVEWLACSLIVNLKILNILYRWEQFKLECYL